MRSKRLAAIAGIAAAIALAGSALAQPGGASPPPNAPLPLEAFARIPFVEQAQLSPDGSSMAGLLGVNGQQMVAILNLFDHADKPVRLAVPEGTQAAWIRWVNNDNILVGLRALLPVEAGSDRWVISRMIGINRQTGKITRLLWDKNGQNTADVLWVAHDGSPTVLAAAQDSIYLDENFWPAVYRLDVEKGRTLPLVSGRGGVMWWSADADGIIRSGVGYNDSTRKFRLLYRGAGKGESFRMIDTADTRKGEEVLDPFLFLPGTDHALALHDNAQGRTAIYEIDLPSQSDVRTVFEAPAGSEVSRVVLSADGATLLGAYLDGGNQSVHWFDPTLADLQQALDKSVAPRRARIISLSADRRRLLIVIDRPESPGALYFFDLADSKMQRVATMNDALGTQPLSPVSMVRYTARDGTPIEAVLTLPGNRAGKHLPLIVLPHGGPWGHDAPDYDYWTQFLANRGYGVLQPNFRGSTGYGTAFLKAGEGQMGLAMQDDLSDGLAWAVQQGIADPRRVCIMGASYGGYAAMWGVAKDPDLYRCAIAIAGVSNLRREVNDFGDSLLGGKYKDDWKRMTPDFAAVSPINAIGRIKVPMLLIHGKKDITVDYAQSANMYAKMREAGKAVELLPLPEADHHFTREADRRALLGAVEVFLARHNPADPAPAVAPAPASGQ